MKLPKCPLCRKKAVILDTIYKNDFGRYVVLCGCIYNNMRGHNKPDLVENWKRWTKCVRALELERRPEREK